MAVRIRLKKMGRKARPFFRVCAMTQQSPRDGRAIEELGTYDPMVPETDARAILNGERIAYWIGVGAQPSPKVSTLIKKYGKDGSHLEAQKEAIERLGSRRSRAIARALESAQSAPKGKSPEEIAAEAKAAAEAAEAEAKKAAEAEAAANAEAVPAQSSDEPAQSSDQPAEGEAKPAAE